MSERLRNRWWTVSWISCLWVSCLLTYSVVAIPDAEGQTVQAPFTFLENEQALLEDLGNGNSRKWQCGFGLASTMTDSYKYDYARYTLPGEYSDGPYGFDQVWRLPTAAEMQESLSRGLAEALWAVGEEYVKPIRVQAFREEITALLIDPRYEAFVPEDWDEEFLDDQDDAWFLAIKENPIPEGEATDLRNTLMTIKEFMESQDEVWPSFTYVQGTHRPDQPFWIIHPKDTNRFAYYINIQTREEIQTLRERSWISVLLVTGDGSSSGGGKPGGKK
jgi:hypothetical protein